MLRAVGHAAAAGTDLKQMPPKEKLTQQEVAAIDRWIRDGAPWPTGKSVATAVAAKGERIGDAWTDPRNPIIKNFGGQRLDLWSLKPVRSIEPPAVKNQQWSRNPIDRFVLAKLETAKLQPSPEADRRTLIRRLTYDLTGLPPTPQETDALLADDSTNAYERLVDRLLASPRFGEHWARQWLDVVRYSDSNGFDWDEFRPQAWRFRDYVIRAYNSDKSFDRFVREQLAGDELLPGPPQTQEQQDQLIATGYLRIGPQDNSAPLFNEQARSRAELMADLTETTGAAFLGLTFSCCRCHDHKYDPLSQADHYRLRAFFAGVKYADDTPIDLADVQWDIRKDNEQADAAVKQLQEEREALLAPVRQRLRDEKIAKLSREDQELLSQKDPPKESKEKLKTLKSKVEPNDKETLASLSADEKSQDKRLAEQIDAKKKQKRAFTTALLATDDAKSPATKIFSQGDYRKELDAVEPGFPSILDPNAATSAKPENPTTSGRRLALAQWIVDPKNPLTARVYVNRVWQGLFGRGIVSTPNDFGLAGARPTHPELLDHLAAEFMRDGWSTKRLIRRIVTSAAYRQSSIIDPARSAEAIKIDPRNELLWRQNPRRLTAEQVRDSLLSVSGQLLGYAGGPPIWPELPPEILQANPAFLDDNAMRTKGWYPSPPEKRNVRGIFFVQKRTVRIPFFETFDLPENAVSCPRRSQSVVAPQALTLMNGPDAVAAAKALADRVKQAAGADPAAQTCELYRVTFQRPPNADELRLAENFLKRRSLAELCRVLLNVNEFVYVD